VTRSGHHGGGRGPCGRNLKCPGWKSPLPDLIGPGRHLAGPEPASFSTLLRMASLEIVKNEKRNPADMRISRKDEVVLLFVLICCMTDSIELGQAAGDRFNETQYELGSNVLAAIDHYSEQVRMAPSNPEFIRHLTTALRFAGRFEECAVVCHPISLVDNIYRL
jgi:hypothetical protein